MSYGAAACMGLLDDAGQTTHERRRVNFTAHAPLASSLFGVKGAGQLLEAATQSMATYNPPAAPPQGAVTYARPSDPAQNQPGPPPPVPAPQAPPPTAKETEGSLKTPLIIGGFLVLLIALYFIAK